MPDAKYTRCVKDTRYMRLHHMHLLKEIRDEVMRGGKRGEIGFHSCRGCHVNRERFCDRCHNAVNLTLDWLSIVTTSRSRPPGLTHRKTGDEMDRREFLKNGGIDRGGDCLCLWGYLFWPRP